MATATGNEVALVNAIQDARGKYLEISAGDMSSFLRESEFAMQCLRRNSSLAGIARNNPMSLRDAIIQGASIGVSLNPVLNHGYLVPRDGAVILDVGYRGLADTAIADGIIAWVRAELVYEKDEFDVTTLMDGRRIVTHKANFLSKNRGELLGGFCEWATPDGHRDAVFETLDDLYKFHRSRSEAWRKSQSGIWKTDEPEAIRKSLIKRAHKRWPRIAGMGKRFDAALAAAIHADGDQVMEQAEAKVAGDVILTLTEKATNAQTPLDKWREFYQVADLGDLTPTQAEDMNRRLDAKLKKMQMDADKAADKEAKKASPADDAPPADKKVSGGKKQETLTLSGEPDDVSDLDALWREIDDGLGVLAEGDMGEADRIGAEIRKANDLPKGDLTAAQVQKFAGAIKSRVEMEAGE